MNEVINIYPRKIPLYIAGSSKERDRFKEAKERIPSAYDLTFDWCASFEALEEAQHKHRLVAGEDAPQLTTAQLGAIGATCGRAVHDAAVLVFLVPTTVSRGFWAELGMAMSKAYRGENIATITVGDIRTLDTWVAFPSHMHVQDTDGLVELLDKVAQAFWQSEMQKGGNIV